MICPPKDLSHRCGILVGSTAGPDVSLFCRERRAGAVQMSRMCRGLLRFKVPSGFTSRTCKLNDQQYACACIEHCSLHQTFALLGSRNRCTDLTCTIVQQLKAFSAVTRLFGCRSQSSPLKPHWWLRNRIGMTKFSKRLTRSGQALQMVQQFLRVLLRPPALPALSMHVSVMYACICRLALRTSIHRSGMLYIAHSNLNQLTLQTWSTRLMHHPKHYTKSYTLMPFPFSSCAFLGMHIQGKKH